MDPIGLASLYSEECQLAEITIATPNPLQSIFLFLLLKLMLNK